MQAEPLIQLEGVGKNFGSVVGVSDLHLTVHKGEFVSLLGPSGCGKTTTLNLIAGFTKVDRGQILLSGRRVEHIPPNQRDLGMVFQSYALFPHLSVSENVAFGLRMRGVKPRERAERSEAALDMVRLNGFGSRRITELSGGQRQRVALARAIVTEPVALLLDEPLSALDANLREEMQSELRDIQQRTKIATVMVTHDQAEALSLSDKIIVMRDGKIEQMGTPTEIYRHSANKFVARFVGETNLIEATVAERQSDRMVARTPSGLAISAPASKDLAVGQDVLISVRPEAVSILPSHKPEAIFPARITRVTYLGSVTKVWAAVGELEIIAQLRNTRGPADHLHVGQDVFICWHLESVQVLHG